MYLSEMFTRIQIIRGLNIITMLCEEVLTEKRCKPEGEKMTICYFIKHCFDLCKLSRLVFFQHYWWRNFIQSELFLVPRPIICSSQLTSTALGPQYFTVWQVNSIGTVNSRSFHSFSFIALKLLPSPDKGVMATNVWVAQLAEQQNSTAF